MIKLPKYEETDWYIEEIKNLYIREGTKNECRESYFQSKVSNIDKSIHNLGITEKDFSIPGSRTLIEELSIANFNDLHKIKNKIDTLGGKKIFYEIKMIKNKNGVMQPKETLKKEWKSIYSAYDKLINRNVNNKMVEYLGIKSCPYCNESYINNRFKKVTAQMDHYFPRNTYPIFAISLYNLVPSCYACNHNKSDKQIGFSPFDNSINYDEITITYIPKSIDYLYDVNEIEIMFNCNDIILNNKLNKNLKQLGINDAYKGHKDYAQELIKKSIIYNKSKCRELYMNYQTLFTDESEMLRIIFGNYCEQDELLKRPLSKITKDLLEEFHII